MVLLSAQQISVTLSDQPLFKDLDLVLNQGEKTALVGINGCGKSTLLSVLARKIRPDSGEVITRRGIRVSLLEQSPDFSAEATVLSQVFSSSSPHLKLLHDYHETCEHPDSPQDLQQLNSLREQIDRLNLWSLEKKVREILAALGIDRLDTPVANLSGGMKKKVALAAALADDAEILLLDEPTNHLDMPTIQWLETHLEKTGRTLLLVTHDRYFLDSVCTGIAEIHESGLRFFSGNFTSFLEKKQALEDLELRRDRRIQSLLSKELEWLRRSPKARGTKSRARISRINTMIDRKQPEKKEKITLKSSGHRLGKKILEIEGISAAFGSLSLFTDFTYSFVKNDRIGFLGLNGCGKTTLLRILTREIPPSAGNIDVGENTRFGFFRQHNDFEDPGMSILNYIRDQAHNIRLSDGSVVSAAQMLERFLFPPSQHRTPLNKLSGGEKRRLYLVRILMSNPNFLILDEPTNDFDIETLRVLEAFLLSYGGCVITVSHDRFFMDRICNRLFVFTSAKTIEEYPGNASEYAVEAAARAHVTPRPPARPRVKPAPSSPGKAKLGFKEKLEFEKLEPEISKLEGELKNIEKKLLTAADDFQEISRLGQIHDETRLRLDRLYLRWEELADRVY